MFQDCSSLQELDLSNFNTNKVLDMSYMFKGCSSLKELDLSNFNTNKVFHMSYMFKGCSSLKELNISNNFKRKISNEIRTLFKGCSKELKEKIKK